MGNVMKKFLALLLTFALMLPGILPACAVEEPIQATVLFTHDLHSHLLPSVDKDGGEYGGYARLMTVIREQKEIYPDAILVDGGDFSMGSLFQTAYPTAALELRIMGAMGYDATTFGNHEFDYLPKGFAAMLNAAVDSGDPLPKLVDGNYWPPKEGEEGYTADSAAVTSAMERYGVKEYEILERGGVYYVIFGLFGYDAVGCAPQSGMIQEEPAAAAQRIVTEATAECERLYGARPIVIALSHGGTEDGEGEDYELAQQVEGIHIIVSGHTHTKLETPMEVGNTLIVSCAEYGKNLGVVQLEYFPDGRVNWKEYTLYSIDETVAEDPEIADLVEAYKGEVEENYLAPYEMTFDQVLTNNSYTFDKKQDLYDYPHESTLGNVFSDAYRWAAQRATGRQVDVALTASGVVRESIPVGDVKVSDIFNAASLGVGTEGELVGIYLTGADLKNALEVDASVYPLMHSAQLFMSGVEYSYNTSRMIFNRVDYAMLRQEEGLAEIQEEKLYYVVCGMYMGQMLGSVERTSYGLLKITPRDENGVAIDMAKISDYLVKDENGVTIKEWYAIASYLQNMGESMDEQYAQPDGRKVIYSSLNPVKLLRNANKFTYILLGVLAALVLAAVLITRAVKRRKKRHNRK